MGTINLLSVLRDKDVQEAIIKATHTYGRTVIWALKAQIPYILEQTRNIFRPQLKGKLESIQRTYFKTLEEYANAGGEQFIKDMEDIGAAISSALWRDNPPSEARGKE